MALATIWLIFTLLFACLALFHWRAAGKAVRPFVFHARPRQIAPGITAYVEAQGLPIDAPLEQFVREFNQYLEVQNRSARQANLVASAGYALAALTAFVSILLAFPWPVTGK